MLQFANPALLFGTLLLAVPLIIHLLNRRRHKRRPGAAMEFLLRAYQKQRRRLRRENLLLLILRCLIPILLALAIARPSLRDSGALGGIGGSAHHVFLFDRSYSMGLDLPSGSTPFERAKQLATLMVDGLDRRSGQKITVMASGLRPSMPISDDLNLARAKERIAALPGPLDTGVDLTETLSQAADLVEEARDDEVSVYLFTDMQVRAFGEDPFRDEDEQEPDPTPPPTDPDASMFEDTAVDAIQRIQEAGNLTVLDMRSRNGNGGSQDNLQIVDIELGVPHAIAKTPVPVRVRLLNRTTSKRDVQATLEIDGEQPLRSNTSLEAGAEGEVTFYVTFRELGQRRIRVEIRGDDLLVDNERYAVVPVRERLRVLFVEGSNESEEDLRDATHVRRILDPTRGEGDPSLTPFAVQTVDTVSFLSGRERPSDYDLVVLANVPRLGDDIAASLESAVRSGTGLLVMLGDRVDPESYNLHLHASGDGLMPMLLLDAARNDTGGDRFFGAEIAAQDHSVFRDFAEPVYYQIFESLPIYSYFRSELPPPPVDDEGNPQPTSQVLATVRDPAQTPLLVAKDFGQGKSLFLTSAISRRPDRWNGLDFEVIAFPLLHQAAHWLALPSIDPFNVEVGASLAATTRRRPLDLAAVLPERAGMTKVPIGDDPIPLLGGLYSLPPFTQTEFSGFYTVEMMLDIGGGQQRDQLVFAVNPPIEEGDLRYFSHQAAREALGIETITTDLPSEGEAAIQSTFSNLGPMFLWAALIFVLAEAAMARWVSGRRV